ncbi:MAG: hypothetical protein KDA85_07900 [Planctomycetaceae bacterium]|nr:hypothetical protein [Planctomycetaceae bacterium]
MHWCQSCLISVMTMSFVCHAGAAQQDGQTPGSAMTLEQLSAAQSRPAPGSVSPGQPATTVTVQPAAEPIPALRYRFYPAKWECRPGQAMLHFSRALVFTAQHSPEQLTMWQTGTWQFGQGDGVPPTADELANVVTSLTPVYAELRAMALSEDFTCDHRLRDIRGPQLYYYLLADVQESRTLARLLKLRIRHQISTRDFPGAVDSIRDGIRLAEFVGQGETLIQQLVGIAIASMMRESITDLIATEGSPNLYWALASIPRPLVHTSDSILWELNNMPQVFPVLEKASDGIWTQAQAAEEWRQLSLQLKSIGGGNGNDGLVAMAVAGAAQTEDARQRLLEDGRPAEQLAAMPAQQILILDTARELRLRGQNLAKAHLLPGALSRSVSRQGQEEFHAWVRQNQSTSAAGIIAGLLFPSVQQAREAELRCTLGFNRLMVLEALRMHAATHNGQLPQSLEELSPVPAMPDPYTDKDFEYTLEVLNGHSTATLKAAGPSNWLPLQVLHAQF